MKLGFKFRQALGVLVSGICACVITYYYPAPESSWLLVSTLLFSLVNQGINFPKNIVILFLTGIITALLIFIAHIAATFVLSSAFFVGVMTYFTNYLGIKNNQFFRLFLLINCIVITSLMIPTTLIMQREKYVLAGMVIVLVLRSVMWPRTLKKEASEALIESLKNLNQLTQTIFSIYTKGDLPDNEYLYAQKLHQERTRILSIMNYLRHIAENFSFDFRKKFKLILENLEHLYEIIISLEGLAYRIADHSNFNMANSELNAIAKNFKSIYAEIIKLIKSSSSFTLSSSENLHANILQFEEVNHNILRVVSADPLSYIYFTQSLNALRDKLHVLGFLVSQFKKAK